MKRLNPQTNTVFKLGDVRDDGYIFSRYMPKRVRKDGFLQEQWMSPEAYEQSKKTSINCQAKARTTPDGRAKFLIKSAVYREKNKMTKVTVTVDWVAERIRKGKCELTGLDFDLKPSTITRHNPYAPSLDRIDSSNKEYSKSNTRVVLASVNVALGEYGTTTMLPILKAMVKAIEEKQ